MRRKTINKNKNKNVVESIIASGEEPTLISPIRTFGDFQTPDRQKVDGFSDFTTPRSNDFLPRQPRKNELQKTTKAYIGKLEIRLHCLRTSLLRIKLVQPLPVEKGNRPRQWPRGITDGDARFDAIELTLDVTNAKLPVQNVYTWHGNRGLRSEGNFLFLLFCFSRIHRH